ncbi:MAG: PAS domain S-box protein [Methanoregula sp.]|nr:PAS domain S-box protein [Methanoregula sp.]
MDPLGIEQTLRDDAEMQLARSPKRSADLAGQTPEELIHELQVHQIELENQAEELRRAHIALGESRDKYLDLYEFAPVGYFTLSNKGLITDVNPKGAQLLGVELSHLLRKLFSTFIAKEDSFKWHQYFLQLLNATEKQVCRLTFRRSDGSMFPARLEGVRTTGNSRLTTVRIAVCDIIDIWQIEALKESEETYRRILETMDDVYYQADMEGTIVAISPSCQKLLGWTPDKLTGTPITDYYLHPQDWKKLLSALRKNGSVHDYEVTMKHRAGWPVRLSVNAHTIFDTKGRPTGIEGTFREISQRKEMEQALQRAAEYNRSLIEASVDPLVTIGRDGTITDVNKATETATGILREDLIGTDFSDYFSDADKARAGYREVFREGMVRDYPLELRHRDGTTISVLYSASVYRDENGGVNGVFAAARDITKRRRAEKALEEARDKYLELYDFAPTGYLSLNDKALITEVNLAAATLLGVKRSELVNHGFGRFITPGDLENWDQYFMHMRNWREKQNCTLMLRRGDGSTFPARLEAVRFTSSSDGISTVSVAVSDITDIKQVEDALRESEEKYRALFAAESDGIFVVDKESGIIIDCNDAVIPMYDYQKDEVIGQPNTLVSAEPDATRAATQEVKGIIPIRYHKRKDGSIFPVEITANVISVQGRDVIIAAVRDITERMSFEKVRRINEERLQMAQDIGHIGCWEYDIKTSRMWGSDEGCHLFGYPKMAGSFPIEAFASCITEPELVLKAFNDLINEGKEYDLDFVINPKDGSTQRTLHSIGILEKDEHGNPVKVKGINQDITGRKRAEEALRQANKKLNLLSSITRHDINNQLTVQMGYLSMLEKKEPDTTHNEYFQKVSTAAKRIAGMIQFTKEYEEIGVHAPTWQDCRTLVDTAAKEGPLGKVMVKDDLPAGAEVFADPLIVKVFYNLMDNAVRYGGNIKTIQFSALESGDSHVIVCEDDGIGIPPKEKEKIFNPGFGKNTGLGLALSREILDITGITIKEIGEPGKGARFEMTVPKGAWRMTVEGD